VFTAAVITDGGVFIDLFIDMPLPEIAGNAVDPASPFAPPFAFAAAFAAAFATVAAWAAALAVVLAVFLAVFLAVRRTPPVSGTTRNCRRFNESTVDDIDANSDAPTPPPPPPTPPSVVSFSLFSLFSLFSPSSPSSPSWTSDVTITMTADKGRPASVGRGRNLTENVCVPPAAIVIPSACDTTNRSAGSTGSAVSTGSTVFAVSTVFASVGFSSSTEASTEETATRVPLPEVPLGPSERSKVLKCS
jgi:hypothetical protein